MSRDCDVIHGLWELHIRVSGQAHLRLFTRLLRRLGEQGIEGSVRVRVLCAERMRAKEQGKRLNWYQSLHLPAQVVAVKPVMLTEIRRLPFALSEYGQDACKPNVW